MYMMLAVFVSFGFICAVSHSFIYRRGCPVMNPVCPCPTYENGCFVCKCTSGNIGASSLFGGFHRGEMPGGQSGTNSSAASLFGGGFQPGTRPDGQIPGSNGTSSEASSGGVCPPDPNNCLPWLLSQDSNGCRTCGSTGLMSHNNGNCPSLDPSCPPMSIHTDANGCPKCAGISGSQAVSPTAPTTLTTPTTPTTPSTPTMQTNPTTPTTPTTSASTQSTLATQTTSPTPRSTQTTHEYHRKPTIMTMFPAISSTQINRTTSATFDSTNTTLASTLLVSITSPAMPTDSPKISNCQPYPTDCTGSTFCEIDAFACLICKCATAASTTETASTTASLTGCQPFPRDCPKEAGCAEFKDWCPVCTCKRSINGTLMHLSSGCRTLNCPLNCGQPPKYMKDYNGCDICECQT